MHWDYAHFEFYLSAALLICAMFGMGTTLTVRDFLDVARSPLGIAVVLTMQVLVTPLIAMGLAWGFSLSAGVAVGLLLVAALPGGLFSNIFTYLGRGNVALSISATAICTLACLVTTTFVLKTFGETQLPADFRMPIGRIVMDIGLCLLLPLTAGMAVRRMLPTRYAILSKIFIRASFVLLLLVIVAGMASGRVDIREHGWRGPIAMFVFITLSIWLSYAAAFLFRLPMKDAFAVCIEVIVRNAHLGVLLKAALFPAESGVSDPLGDAVLYVVLFYGVLSLFYGGFEVLSRRRQWGLHADRFTAFGGPMKEAGS